MCLDSVTRRPQQPLSRTGIGPRHAARERSIACASSCASWRDRRARIHCSWPLSISIERCSRLNRHFLNRRYTGTDVLRRLSSLVVAVLLIAAPLSAAICDATCAGHAYMTGETPVGHTSHHHDSTATHEHGSHRHHAIDRTECDSSATRIEPLSRICDHVGAVVTAQIERSPFGHYALAARSVGAVADTEIASALARLDNRHGPPVPGGSISPLRI